MNLLSLLFLLNSFNNSEIGLATTYWPGDGQSGTQRADGKKFTWKDKHIAHRTLPLGTKVKICNVDNNLCVDTIVLDRGPYGFCREIEKYKPHCKSETYPHPWERRGTWKKMCPKGFVYRVRVHKGKRCGFYRGIIDMTPWVTKQIKANGFQKVIIYY